MLPVIKATVEINHHNYLWSLMFIWKPILSALLIILAHAEFSGRRTNSQWLVKYFPSVSIERLFLQTTFKFLFLFIYFLPVLDIELGPPVCCASIPLGFSLNAYSFFVLCYKWYVLCNKAFIFHVWIFMPWMLQINISQHEKSQRTDLEIEKSWQWLFMSYSRD